MKLSFKLFGDWFALEMVMHYEGRRKILQPDFCVMIYLNGTKDNEVKVEYLNKLLVSKSFFMLKVGNKHRGTHYNVIDLSLRNLNSTNAVTQELKYALRINSTKQGLWTDSEFFFNL